jgi:hypothetical protein
MSPDVRRAPRLLFVSDNAAYVVDIFTLPGMALKGQLTGFNSPQGECADATGNIWITNTGTSELLQYSRTGTLIRRLSDTFGYPVGCSVNKATGDLAVTDIFDRHSSHGGVLVYAGASGQPKDYTCSGTAVYEYYFVGYGPDGSLWVDGTDRQGYFGLCTGTPSALSPLALSGGAIYFPGLVQWDSASGQWYVGDQLCNDTMSACIYPISGSGVVGSAINLSGYSGSYVCDLVQAVIANGGTYVVGSDNNYCGNATPASYRWLFPAGGSPSNYNNSAGLSRPIGAAISTK